jgi:branched-chain amino acid transport system substrate-binding protein
MGEEIEVGEEPDEDVARAGKLIEIPGLVGIVGHNDSLGALLTAPIYNEAGIPHIVPTSTSRRLKKCGPWTFTLAPDEVSEGGFIGDFLATHLRLQTATVFYQADEYGAGLRDALADALAKRGVRVIDQVSFDWMHRYPKAQDKEIYSSIVSASLRRGVPDAAIIAGRGREAAHIARLIHARAPQVIFIGSDGVLVREDFLSIAGPAAEMFYLATFWYPDAADETSRSFVEKFRRIVGRAPLPADAMKYDAAMLLAEAIREVGADRKAVRQYLADLGVTRPAWRGVTGEISFAPDRPARLVMTRIRSGAAVLVSTSEGN